MNTDFFIKTEQPLIFMSSEIAQTAWVVTKASRETLAPNACQQPIYLDDITTLVIQNAAPARIRLSLGKNIKNNNLIELHKA